MRILVPSYLDAPAQCIFFCGIQPRRLKCHLVIPFYHTIVSSLADGLVPPHLCGSICADKGMTQDFSEVILIDQF